MNSEPIEGKVKTKIVDKKSDDCNEYNPNIDKNQNYKDILIFINNLNRIIIHNSLYEFFKHEMKNSLKDEIFKKEMENSMNEGMKHELKNTLDFLKNEMKYTLNECLKHELKSTLNECLKDELKNSLNQCLKDELKEINSENNKVILNKNDKPSFIKSLLVKCFTITLLLLLTIFTTFLYLGSFNHQISFYKEIILNELNIYNENKMDLSIINQFKSMIPIHLDHIKILELNTTTYMHDEIFPKIISKKRLIFIFYLNDDSILASYFSYDYPKNINVKYPDGFSFSMYKDRKIIANYYHSHVFNDDEFYYKKGQFTYDIKNFRINNQEEYYSIKRIRIYQLRLR